MEPDKLFKSALRRALVDRCGVSRPQSYRLIDGESVPSLALAVAAEDKIGIPVRAWLDGTLEQEATRFVAALAS